MKKHSSKLSFFIFVILPTIIASLYYGYFASNQYYIETKYVIQGGKQVQSDLLGGLASLTGGSSSSAKNAYIAREYIWSANLLQEIDKELAIREHYTNTGYDWWARLKKEASFKEFVDYWYDIIYINHDTTSEITTLGVMAFSAEKAYAISTRLLEKAEERVNRLSERSQNDALIFAKKELAYAEKKLVDARLAVIAFRSNRQEIDPEKSSAAKLEIVAALEGQLATTETELSELSAYMRASSFKIRSLKSKIQALKKQIVTEKERWGRGSKNNESSTLSTLMGDYEKLLAKKMIAERLYESALASLETARLTAMQQQQYLEVIVAPYLPLHTERPYAFMGILSVFLGAFLMWAIGSLILSAIKDHV